MTNSLIRPIQQAMQSWLRKKEIAEPDEALVALPDILGSQLMQQIQALPSPQPYQAFVQQELAAAVETWQQNLDAPNILVFLGSPVEPIAKILHDSLEHWQNSPLPVTIPIPCRSRSRDPLLLTQQIQQALTSYKEIDPTVTNDADEPVVAELNHRTNLMVVPCLDQCFLRCIGGWEGIEYLRHIAINHRSCFWVIGCSHWAWDFLDFVCQISAYFSEVKPLPELDGGMLKDWLDPITKTVIKFEPNQIQLLKENKSEFSSDERRQAYWDSLASQSLGVSRIAAKLWLQSLRIEKAIVENEDLSQAKLGKTTPQEQPFILYETKPSLPDLPELTDIDRYLLHSLLIHGQITSAHLAFSLGQQEGQVQTRIQALLREGVLERSSGALAVQASHYPRLKAELENNNFFAAED